VLFGPVDVEFLSGDFLVIFRLGSIKMALFACLIKINALFGPSIHLRPCGNGVALIKLADFFLYSTETG
jgi:hypothetical protein